MEELMRFLLETRTIFAAALGAALTWGLQLLLKHIEFKNDYYKWIVRRRISACESIEFAMRPFMIELYESKKKYFVHNAILFGTEHHPLYSVGLDTSLKYSLENPKKTLIDIHIEMNYVHRFSEPWVSDELSKELRALIDFLAEKVDVEKISKAQSNDMTREDRLLRWTASEKHYTEIRSFTQRIQKLLFREYLCIHDAKGFLKQRSH